MPHRLDCKNICRYLLLGAHPIQVAQISTSQANWIDKEKMISTRRKLVEPDVDTDEAPVGEDVRRWPDTADSGSPSLDSVRRSSISFKQKEPTLSSSVVVGGQATRTDDRLLVSTTPKDGCTRAGRGQIGAQRGAMMDEEGAGEEERSSREDLPWLYGEADVVGTERRTEEPDVVVDDEIGGRTTSAVTKRRVQRGALSVIATRRTISTRQHPVEDETDPEVAFKTLSRATAAVTKPSSRKTVTRGGIAMASGRVTD